MTPTLTLPLLANRYDLLHPLGRGAHGEVWAARDRITGDAVAIKRLAPGAEPPRVRREVAVLRMLRIPGVVRLLDEGEADGQPFLVMDLVEGSPFPGVSPPHTWPSIAPATFSLLETLHRVHAAGIIHRDLKPANVFVHPSGTVTLLDFGISYGGELGAALTTDGSVLGTPLFLAPEQVSSDPVGPRADLYAVGVMLYLALTGRPPHRDSDVFSLLRAKITDNAVPVAKLAPDLPPFVARTIDALLDRVPERRPRSAAEVAARLSGASVDDPATLRLPWIGDRSPVQALLLAARSGQSLDLTGPAGAGKARCLTEVMGELRAAGVEPVELAASKTPFASLAPILGELSSIRGSLPDVRRQIGARLAAALAEGKVLVAHLAHVDAATAALLPELRSGGCVLIAREQPEPGLPSVPLAPWSAEDIGTLVAGPERVFHVRSGVARLLHERTAGLPGAVLAELDGWVQAGVARRDGAQWHPDRAALTRMSAGFPVALSPRSRAQPTVALPVHLQELVRWIAVAGPDSDVETLAAVTGDPTWQIEALAEELVVLGVAERRGHRLEIPRVRATLSGEQRRAAHRALAEVVPAGTPSRLLHLVLAADDEVDAAESAAIADEAFALAARLAREGRLSQATQILSEGVLACRRAAARRGRAVDAERRLLREWVLIALQEQTTRSLDRVAYEIARATKPDEELQRLTRLALAVLGGPGDRALSLDGTEQAHEDEELELARRELRVFAARRSDIGRYAKAVEDACVWASARGGEAAARMAAWRARLRYQQGRFPEAAELHFEAATRTVWPAIRLRETLYGAASLLEDFRHEEALRHAIEARGLAEACGHPYDEAEAEWLIRCALYRLSRTTGADQELVEVVEELSVPDIEARVCLQEGTAAWRAGDLATGSTLGDRAARIWRTIGKPWSVLLARSLALACGARPSDAEEPHRLALSAPECPILGVGAQAIALLVDAQPKLAVDYQHQLDALLADIPADHRGKRIDVLSADEVMARVRGHADNGR